MKCIGVVALWCAGLLICSRPATADVSQPYEPQEGIEILVSQLLTHRDLIKERKVAVTDLRPLSGDLGRLGAALSESIFDRFGDNKVKLLERRLLQAALDEMNLDMTDLVADDQHKKKFGRLTGTEILLVGTVTDLGESLEINARLIEIETSRVIAAGHVEIQKTKTILGQMGVPIPGNLNIETTSSSKVFLDGRPLGTADRRGSLKTGSIEPGTYNLRISREGYRSVTQSVVIGADQELRVERSLSRLPSPGTAVALSLILPGAGDLYLGRRDWWVYPIAIGGSLYGAYAYSKKADDLVQSQDGSKLEKRGRAPAVLLAGLAAAIWIYDLYHVHSAAERVRAMEANVDRFGVEVNPTDKQVLVKYRWKLR